jgi:hypothetical protein
MIDVQVINLTVILRGRFEEELERQTNPKRKEE